MRARLLAAAAVLAGLALPSCAPEHVRVKDLDWTLPAQDVNIRPSLRAWLKTHPEPKVVLRVPNAQVLVTESGRPSQQSRADAAVDYNHVYDLIEKALFKAGFVVRDRALLANLLKDEKINSYKEIRSRVDTDLIIEISSLRFNDPADVAKTQSYRDDQGHPLGGEVLGQAVAHMEAKVVMVETGEVGGILDVHRSRCSVEPACVYTLGFNSYAFNRENLSSWAYLWQRGNGPNGIDAATSLLAQQLVASLRP